MSIWTIADLHLSYSTNKPMNIFGENWNNHEDKIKKNWLENVKKEDTVILPGDFSWATYIEDTILDFKYINDLPGKKILLKGNHDYWWTTLKKMKEFINQNGFENIDFLYNNSYLIENKVIVGTRGWIFTEEDDSKKMIARETERLKLSIKNAIEKYGVDKEIIAFMHYPPIVTKEIENEKYMEFYNTLKQYNIKECYYGHLHGNSLKGAIEGKVGNIDFHLISADHLEFKLLKING